IREAEPKPVRTASARPKVAKKAGVKRVGKAAGDGVAAEAGSAKPTKRKRASAKGAVRKSDVTTTVAEPSAPDLAGAQPAEATEEPVEPERSDKAGTPSGE